MKEMIAFSLGGEFEVRPGSRFGLERQEGGSVSCCSEQLLPISLNYLILLPNSFAGKISAKCIVES